MRNSTYKAAKSFIKKDLRNKVDFKTVTAYLQSRGFSVVLYNHNKDNELLIKYNLVERSKTVKGFTVYNKDFKAVFIDDSTAREEKLCVLLHETAHIILGHIDKKDVQDGRLMEMEADAFAYHILYPEKKINWINILCICISIISMATAFYCSDSKETTVVSMYMPETVSTTELNEIVYVTPSGTKYHRSDCRYIKGKKCTELTIETAQKHYAPCSVCKP